MKKTITALVACAIALANCRPAEDPVAQSNRLFEEQRAAETASARINAEVAQAAQNATAKQAERAQQDRRDQEQAARDREQASRIEVTSLAKSHADECRSTYRSRFIDMQNVLGDYVTTRPKMAAECKRLATHCTTMTGGVSVCHGITGAQQKVFDETCSIWPRIPVVGTANEDCADVDPERLGFDFSWSIEDAAAFRKRQPPSP